MTEPTDGRAEPTDEQIKARAQEYWEIKFNNWGGDSLNECVNELATDDSEEAEGRVYGRAEQLLNGAKITVAWPGSEQANEVAAELRRQADLVQARREEDLEAADYRWFRDHLRGRAAELDDGAA